MSCPSSNTVILGVRSDGGSAFHIKRNSTSNAAMPSTSCNMVTGGSMKQVRSHSVVPFHGWWVMVHRSFTPSRSNRIESNDANPLPSRMSRPIRWIAPGTKGAVHNIQSKSFKVDRGRRTAHEGERRRVRVEARSPSFRHWIPCPIACFNPEAQQGVIHALGERRDVDEGNVQDQST